jgi:hypothetical protein
MGAEGAGGGSRRDLVVVALPSVQRFITEARTTSDVAAASAIYSALAEKIVSEFAKVTGVELVLPAADESAPRLGSQRAAPGMPNRVVALFPEKTGKAAAQAAVDVVRDAWEGWVRRALGRKDGPVPETPGFPVVQWVCVPPEPGGYAAQWDKAQRLLAARRRVRDFAAVPEDGWRRRALCSLSPRWPAEPKAPSLAAPHDKDAKLSAVGWVKRTWRRAHGDAGFPSTASIASAPYRQAILRGLADEDVAAPLAALASAAAVIDAPPETPVRGLRGLIPDSGPGAWLGRSGGPWVYPERWQPESLARETPITDRAHLAAAADAGAKAARELREAMAKRGVPLASYLAVVVQDIDNMGLFLSGDAVNSVRGKIKIEVIPNEHRRLSQVLVSLAGQQAQALRDPALLGVPVYAGGDDLLAFTPAATALRAAEEASQAIPPGLPHASTAVLFFHYHASIQQAMSTARHLLDDAKDKVAGKHALAVGYLRRSGVSEVSMQPWPGPDGESTAALFGLFAKDAEFRLSPRLAADLERDADALEELRAASERHNRRELYVGEVARLVHRHMSTQSDRSDRSGESGDQPKPSKRAALDAARRMAVALDWLGRHERAPGETPGDVPGPYVAARVGVFLRQEAATPRAGGARGLGE